MPTVPTYDSFQAAASTLSPARLSAPNIQDHSAQQMQQLGREAQRFSGALGKIALDMQQQANQLRVDDALNKAKEAALRLTYDKDSGFTSLKGINALERPDGKALEDEYGEALQQEVDHLSATLSNDAQRQAFAKNANDIVRSLRGDAIRHRAQEYKTHALSVAEGILATSKREITLGYRDPDIVDSAISRMGAQVYRVATLRGESAEWQEATLRKQMSSAHRLAIEAALDNNDVAYANGYFKRYSKHMEADDLVHMRKRIDDGISKVNGIAASDTVFQSVVSRFNPSDFDKAFNILLQTESGGRQFGADGTPLTSLAGAIGIAQVMPGTAPEAAKLAGLPWDENRYKTDQEYNKALGRAYFAEMLRLTDGSLPHAYASYNAGYARVKSAMRKAEATGGNWLEQLPEETKNYVAKNMRAFSSGKGSGSRPTLQELDDALRADPRIAGDTEAYDVGRKNLEHRFKLETEAIKQREDEAMSAVMEALIANGGNMAVLSPSLLDSTPADKRDTLLNFADRIAKGSDRTDVSKWLEFTNLPPASMARMTPQQLMAEYRPYFSDSDIRRANEILLAAKGLHGGKPSPEGLQLMTTTDLLKRTAREIGVLPASGNKIKPAEEAKYLAFSDRVQARISQWEADNGKKASSEVLRSLLDEEKLNIVRYDEWGRDEDHAFASLTPEQQKKAYVLVGKEEISLSSIPARQRAQIVEALQASGRAVTEREIARLWVQNGKPK